MESPETLARYKAATTKGSTPFNVAVADFLNAPDIVRVYPSGYVGDKILVDATDDFAVTSVTVKIVNENGTVEEGTPSTASATGESTPPRGRTTTPRHAKSSSRPTDMPGNVTESESSLQMS